MLTQCRYSERVGNFAPPENMKPDIMHRPGIFKEVTPIDTEGSPRVRGRKLSEGLFCREWLRNKVLNGGGRLLECVHSTFTSQINFESKCMKRGMKQGVNFKMSMEPTPFARADELVVSVMQITAGIKPNWDDMIYWKE